MSDNGAIPLERGLCFYFEQEDEFARRSTPVEKQVALAYEAGFQAGKAEINSKITMNLKPDMLRV